MVLRKDTKHYFWVDQICIDQTNTDERIQQVRLMSTIYRHCSSITIWLGNVPSEYAQRFVDREEERANAEEGSTVDYTRSINRVYTDVIWALTCRVRLSWHSQPSQPRTDLVSIILALSENMGIEKEKLHDLGPQLSALSFRPWRSSTDENYTSNLWGRVCKTLLDKDVPGLVSIYDRLKFEEL
jgi:hypothetical protein